jgi:hypothetical protein
MRRKGKAAVIDDGEINDLLVFAQHFSLLFLRKKVSLRDGK